MQLALQIESCQINIHTRFVISDIGATFTETRYRVCSSVRTAYVRVRVLACVCVCACVGVSYRRRVLRRARLRVVRRRREQRARVAARHAQHLGPTRRILLLSDVQNPQIRNILGADET